MKIPVTKPYLPDIKKFKRYIDRIYKNVRLTNNGPLLKELNDRLCDYLEVSNLLLVSSGTIALQIAYKALNLKDEVITTPFSFLATTSSMVWEGLKPVYCDIDSSSLNIDEKLIEKQITPKTRAIVPVHVFGNVCHIDKIKCIADKHSLKVLYDAAHAFGVRYKKKGILNFGDISIISFHATKIFHTIEGGALAVNNDFDYEIAKAMINFGLNHEKVEQVGINAKMNEFSAAMGLCVLDDITLIHEEHERIYYKYMKSLNGWVEFPSQNSDIIMNYNYFPILFRDEKTLLMVESELKNNSIQPRRYFYPSLDTLSYLCEPEICHVSRSISKKILCLPIYFGLTNEEQNKVIKIIKRSL